MNDAFEPPNYISPTRRVEYFTRSDGSFDHARRALRRARMISLLRAVIALHALVDNKTTIGKAELEEGEKEKEKLETKDSEELNAESKDIYDAVVSWAECMFYFFHIIFRFTHKTFKYLFEPSKTTTTG
jgi:uncharacterized membrane protein